MVVFCTSMWNHHLGPVCVEMEKRLGDDFRLLLSLPLDNKYVKACGNCGLTVVPPNEPWIVGPPARDEGAENDRYAALILDAHVAVVGAMAHWASDAIRRRVDQGKLTFFMGERFFKSPWRWFDYLNPRQVLRWYRVHRFYSRRNVHYLAMSHWCADDLAFLHACKGRVWRWGYLPPVSDKPTEKPVREKVRIGWCGRFLCLKNVCDILQASSLLENSLKEKIEVTLVGDGPEKGNLVRLVHDLGLDGMVEFKPFMSAADAKAFMRDLDIYVFPSGRQEGWGAVLSEAMDASCAVVANEAAGSTLELVKDGENGFAYKDGDLATLTRRLGELVKDVDLRKRFGLEAWRTMQNWSPAMGAERLADLVRRVLDNEEPSVTEGLCSRVRAS